MQHQEQLENHLRVLKLPAFLENYQTCAQDAARLNHSGARYLHALCEMEIAQREANRIERAITSARFPFIKELSSYDFSAVTNIAKAQVFDLAQGGYISKAETIILIGNPGLGKTHIAIGLALEACRQGKRVRFYGTAALVNDLQAAQKDLRLSRFLAPFSKLDVLVLDELGFIPLIFGRRSNALPALL